MSQHEDDSLLDIAMSLGSDSAGGSTEDAEDLVEQIREAFEPEDGTPLLQRAQDLAPGDEARQHVLDTALHRRLHPDDPIWTILIAAGLAARWQQQTLERVAAVRHAEVDRIRQEIEKAREAAGAEISATLARAQAALAESATSAHSQIQQAAGEVVGRVAAGIDERATAVMSRLQYRVDELVQEREPPWWRRWLLPPVLSAVAAAGGAAIAMFAADDPGYHVITGLNGGAYAAPASAAHIYHGGGHEYVRVIRIDGGGK